MTNDIFLLTKLEKSYFGDKEELATVVGWTPHLAVARSWRESSHMMERRDFERVKEVDVDRINGSVVISVLNK